MKFNVIILAIAFLSLSKTIIPSEENIFNASQKAINMLNDEITAHKATLTNYTQDELANIEALAKKDITANAAAVKTIKMLRELERKKNDIVELQREIATENQNCRMSLNIDESTQKKSCNCIIS